MLGKSFRFAVVISSLRQIRADYTAWEELLKEDLSSTGQGNLYFPLLHHMSPQLEQSDLSKWPF